MLQETAEHQIKADTERSVILQKVWLPRFVYDSLPYFYLISGIAALFATLYIHHWAWVVPHYLLFSVACIHLGVAVFRKRRKRRTP